MGYRVLDGVIGTTRQAVLRETRAGAVSAEAVLEFARRGDDRASDPLAEELARLRQVLAAGGWRARLMRWLVGRGVGAAKS